MNPHVIIRFHVGQRQGAVIGNGVTLYFACSGYPTGCTPGQVGASFQLSGNGALQLTPPSLGLFAGITIFVDRNNSATSLLSGNGTSFYGTIYMKSGTLQLSGNGNALHSNIVVDQIKLSGNGSLLID